MDMDKNIYSKISELKKLYKFKNPEQIESFLGGSGQHLVDVLFKAHNRILKVFKDNVKSIQLEYENDVIECLFVVIETRLKPKENMLLLEQIDKDWWLKLDFKDKERLIIFVR